MLSEAQINKINNEIEKHDISFSHLKDDILDHLCCEIESLISQGLEFENAFERVFNKLIKKDLKKVQRETIFLINLKVYERRKKLFILATFATLSFFLGVLLQFFDSRFDRLFKLVGLFIMLGFIPLFFANNFKQKVRKHTIFNITCLLTCLITTGAILFTIQDWAYKTQMFLLSAVTIITLFIPTYIWSIFKYRWNKIIHLSFAYFIIIFISLQLSSFHYKNFKQNSTYINQEKRTEAYLNFYNSELTDITDTLSVFNQQINHLLVLSDSLHYNLEQLKYKIKQQKQTLLDRNTYNRYVYETDFQNITNQINNFRNHCLKYNLDPQLTDFINQSFYTNSSDKERWQQVHLFQPFPKLINNISKLQQDIRFVEIQIILSTTNQIKLL